jgi:hypothetical protein
MLTPSKGDDEHGVLRICLKFLHSKMQSYVWILKWSEDCIQYSPRHSVINHYDRHITHLADMNISFVPFNIC